MVERYRSKKLAVSKPVEKSSVKFIPSGCTLLDCVLGGGWALGRIVNIVGDKSTGKTLLAIEACANFARKYPKGKIWYREVESAFDVSYAQSVGLPLERVDFGPDGIDTQWDTMEDVFEDLDQQLAKKAKQGLYIVDSLDALSSRTELKRKLDEGTYAMEKQKLLGELFRRLKWRIKDTNTCVMFISQVRAKIGARHGDKLSRTGGKSLDFFNSQEIWLSHLKTLVRTVRAQKRATGVRILVKCKKNKVGNPYDTCEFNIRFGFGVDDLEASLDWLVDTKAIKKLGIGSLEKYLDEIDTLSNEDFAARSKEVQELVVTEWNEIAREIKPTRVKYLDLEG